MFALCLGGGSAKALWLQSHTTHLPAERLVLDGGSVQNMWYNLSARCSCCCWSIRHQSSTIQRAEVNLSVKNNKKCPLQPLSVLVLLYFFKSVSYLLRLKFYTSSCLSKAVAVSVSSSGKSLVVTHFGVKHVKKKLLMEKYVFFSAICKCCSRCRTTVDFQNHLKTVMSLSS